MVGSASDWLMEESVEAMKRRQTALQALVEKMSPAQVLTQPRARRHLDALQIGASNKTDPADTFAMRFKIASDRIDDVLMRQAKLSI